MIASPTTPITFFSNRKKRKEKRKVVFLFLPLFLKNSSDVLCYKRLLADGRFPKYQTHRDAWNIFLPLIRHLSPEKKIISRG